VEHSLETFGVAFHSDFGLWPAFKQREFAGWEGITGFDTSQISPLTMSLMIFKLSIFLMLFLLDGLLQITPETDGQTTPLQCLQTYFTS